ncbi:MAG: acyltransferase [Parafilimonas terrae]|nr:acyltransferase [Parafilimonas terrae]
MRSLEPAGVVPPLTDDLFVFDIARALAAALVLLSHARHLLVRDAGAEPSLGLAGQAFYSLSGLGHQAVMVFFVISGFLVTRSMQRQAEAGRWSLPDYGLTRLVRLWTVLLPCLLLGGLLDTIGQRLVPGYGVASAPPPPVGPFSLDAVTLLGNAVFRQTVDVPVFGTNNALWSLAYEAHYYAAAGLLFAAWRARRHPLGLSLSVGGTVAVLLLMSRPMLMLYPIWMIGAGAALASRYAASGNCAVRAGAITAFALALVLARLGGSRWQDATDGLIAVTAAWTLLASRAWCPARSAWTDAGRTWADRSYTLYASHLPLLTLLAAVTVGSHRLPFGAAATVLVGAACILGLAWATLLWWLFERHTPAVQRWAERLLARGRAPTGFGVTRPEPHR